MELLMLSLIAIGLLSQSGDSPSNIVLGRINIPLPECVPHLGSFPSALGTFLACRQVLSHLAVS
jgi:hypothetical protein